MEESKYYTPGIEEFCVGFEFEERYLGWKDKWSGWSKRTINNLINLDTFNRFIHKDFKYYEDIKEYEFRVKYLDSQDIIDCGFETSEDWSFKGSEGFVKEAEDSLGNMREEYAISLMDNNTVTIMKYTDFTRLPNVIFRGTIKNKHELQTILKMIGVL